MIEPINNNVLLKRLNEFKNQSGIIFTNNSDFLYEVVAVSQNIVVKIKVGDLVLINDNEVFKITDEGKDYILVNEKNILAIKKG